jgi:hypothetical protein
MKLFLAKALTILTLCILITPEAWATRVRYKQKNPITPSYISTPSYQYYGTTPTPTCTNFSSASVGVGTLSYGVIVTIDSDDYTLQNCIKNTSWVSYFTRYGSNVSTSISYTTRWVQITATANDVTTISNLQNAQWKNIITGYTYNTPYTQPYYYTQPTYIPPPTYSIPSCPTNTYYNNTSICYTPPARTYKAGSSIFPNTNSMYRAITYISNGIKLTLSSADYSTMRYLQWYQYSSLFTDFVGVSISTSNISWWVEVTITWSNSSTIDQINRIGQAIVYQ